MKNISATQPVVLVAQNSGGGQHQGRPCPQAFILQEALAAPKNVCFRGVDKGFPFFKNPRSAQLFFGGGDFESKPVRVFLSRSVPQVPISPWKGRNGTSDLTLCEVHCPHPHLCAFCLVWHLEWFKEVPQITNTKL